MENNGDIEEVYRRFKAEALHGKRDMYYDSDDLVVVFDIAGDYEDYHTQLKALLLGARLFPGDEELELRAGLFLDTLGGNEALVPFLKANNGRKGLVWEILRLKSTHPGAGDIEAQLDAMVDANRFNDDEEIIQFVNLIEDTQQQQWLARNAMRFVDKCQYRDTALNEVASVLQDTDAPLAIKLLDELSSIDPFNTETWGKLAELHGREGNVTEGLQAIDYALAIDPAGSRNRFIKGCLLMQGDPASQEATEIFADAFNKTPAWVGARINLSISYMGRGMIERAVDLWVDQVTSPENSSTAASHLIDCGMSGEDTARIDALLLQVKEYRADEELLARRVENYMASSRSDRALAVMRQYDSEIGIYENAYTYIGLMYAAGDIEGVAEYVERQRPDNAPQMKLTAPALAMHAASLLRLGRYDDALEATRQYLDKKFTDYDNLDFKMGIQGFMHVLRKIAAIAATCQWNRDDDPLAMYLE